MAACYVTNQEEYPDNIAELTRRDPNRWREVELLAAVRVSEAVPMSWALVEALCDRDLDEPDVTSEDAWGALLAGQALVETTNIEHPSPRNQRKIEKIRHWLVAILTEQAPFDSIQGKASPFPVIEHTLAGNILARLGDLRPGVGLREDGLPDILWCEVSAGTFLMGSDPTKDLYEDDDEQPQHEVYLSAYHISRYPVTNIQYRAFVEDGGYAERWQHCWTSEGWERKEQENLSEPERWGGVFDLPNHPVVAVSWYEASAFCQWLTICLQENRELTEAQIVRLPTEDEWEKAARSEDGRTYPWGKEVDSNRWNYSDTGLGATSTVGCFPGGASPYGCEDLSGNVDEWCQDWHDKKYYSNSPKEDPPGPASGRFRVVRGGSWGNYIRFCRLACRGQGQPGSRDGSVGFRLVRTSS